MKSFFVALVVSQLIWYGCAGTKSNEKTNCKLEIGVWQYSNTDDVSGEINYALKENPPKISRPRNEITFLPNGEVLLKEVQPNDTLLTKNGQWKLEGNVLQLEIDSEVIQYEIVLCNEKNLIIKKI